MIASEVALDYVTAEGELISHALRTLQERTAITGSVSTFDPFASAQQQADATLRLQHPNGTHHYWVECKSSIDRKEQLNKVQQQLKRFEEDGLLIAPYLSRELAEYCRTIDLQFIDLSGNAYLHTPGLFVFMTGEKRSPIRLANDEPKGLTNSATLRVVFALLSHPALLNSSFKSIASAAGVSLGTAYNVLNDLQRRGYLIDSGCTRRRKLLEPDRLINEWAINFPATLRPKLHRRRFSAPDPEWWRSVQLDAFHCAWSSEVAAYKLTGYLKPLTQTLYVGKGEIDSVIRMLVKQHRLKPDADGNIEILEEFWQTQASTELLLAPPLLVYAELLALMDPRTDEAANLIKEKYIDPTFDQA